MKKSDKVQFHSPQSSPSFSRGGLTFILLSLAFLLPAAMAEDPSPEAPPSAPSPAVPPSATPAVPRGIAMVANSANSVTLAWYHSPTDDAKGYNVYSSDKADGTFTRLASVTERTFTQGNLTEGTTYFYKVAATNANGESALSEPVKGFTITPCPATPFPVRLAGNMCVSLNSTILSDQEPLTGTLAGLVDDSDATSCRLRTNCEVKIKLDPNISLVGTDYLLINFRTDCADAEWSNDRLGRTLQHYVVSESLDSTTGSDGTWKEVASGTNGLLDGVIVFPNHQPKWIAVKNAGDPNDPDAAEASDPQNRHLFPSDLILCRLNVFRSAPAGYRNDYWIFTGDSLIVGDMFGGKAEGRSAWFSDLVRQQHPDRYPIVVHAGRGGEMLKDTEPRMQKILPELSPDNGTKTPTGTIVCWETGFNDVGVGASLESGEQMIKGYESALEFCKSKGLIMVPVRIEYSIGKLDMKTMEPENYNVFYNTLAVNLGGLDVFCRASTPYACDPKTQLPYADYWTYTHENFATALNTTDGVHHLPAGADGINRLWADVADKMIYAAQKP